MSWDFSTDVDYQEQLDWMAEFVREEIWPLEAIWPELGLDGLRRAIAPLAFGNAAPDSGNSETRRAQARERFADLLERVTAND
jgi:hypothetical protein